MRLLHPSFFKRFSVDDFVGLFSKRCGSLLKKIHKVTGLFLKRPTKSPTEKVTLWVSLTRLCSLESVFFEWASFFVFYNFIFFTFFCLKLQGGENA